MSLLERWKGDEGEKRRTRVAGARGGGGTTLGRVLWKRKKWRCPTDLSRLCVSVCVCVCFRVTGYRRAPAMVGTFGMSPAEGIAGPFRMTPGHDVRLTSPRDIACVRLKKNDLEKNLLTSDGQQPTTSSTTQPTGGLTTEATSTTSAITKTTQQP